jgi:predicted phage terminase large subunit-like protein
VIIDFPLTPLGRKQKAAIEALRRRSIRGSFLEWCEVALPKGLRPDARHHRAVIDTLERVARGELSRVMIFAPPASGKSIYTSVLYPVWYLAQHPTASILSISNTYELAETFGGAARKLVLEHDHLLGYKISRDSHAAGNWATDKGGKYFAAGTGGAIVGRRGNLILIDDPIKGAEDADSKSARDRVFNWFNRDLKTRLSSDNDPIVIIQTRWGTDDLSGRLLEEAERTGIPWTVISLPAVAEENDILGRQPGEYLWPENSSYVELLKEHRELQTSRAWSSLYQQSPVAEGGNFFKAEWFHECAYLPPKETMKIFATADYAVSEGKGDWTVLMVFGLTADNKLHLLDLWRGRTSTAFWVEHIFRLHQQWQPQVWAEESGVILKAVEPIITAQARQRGVYPYRVPFPSTRDKSARARGIQGFLEMNGGLYLPRAAWVPEFLNEILSFPSGKTDDQADALSLAGRVMGKLQAPRPELLQKPKLKVLTVGDPATQIGTSLEDLWDAAEHRARHVQRI